MNGYAHPAYAHSLAEFGCPRHLPASNGWLLERPIPGFPDRDLMGCYPLFACQDWSQLANDLAALEDELVSMALVADPFGNYEVSSLDGVFDVVRPFKQHYVVELGRSPHHAVCRHHRRYAHRALRSVQIEQCPEPARHLSTWTELYTYLIARHHVRGIRAFSPAAFATQLQTPGMVLLRAVHEQTTVGMTLWYIAGDVAYYHLAAYTPAAYPLRASFAMLWQAIDYFAALGLSWINLGAGAGVTADADDGLSRYKRGWASDTRPAYFCGRILNPGRYAALVATTGTAGHPYFPAYRQGEFS